LITAIATARPNLNDALDIVPDKGKTAYAIAGPAWIAREDADARAALQPIVI